MNPITKALQDLRYAIPKEILEKTFISKQYANYVSPVSLDARIREEVIEKRVMVDCNLVGGTQVAIPLEGIPREQVDYFTYVFRIPKNRTQGRTIVRVISVSFGQGNIVGHTNLGFQGSNPLLDAANQMISSHLPIPQVSTAYATLVGENTVAIVDSIALPTNIFLRCWIENDENLNHLSPASYQHFTKLVELAVKSYVYINNQIPMDQNYIFAGHEIGKFKEIIDEYRDAEENYRDFLNTTWRKTALLNDFHGKRRHIAALTGGGH